MLVSVTVSIFAWDIWGGIQHNTLYHWCNVQKTERSRHKQCRGDYDEEQSWFVIDIFYNTYVAFLLGCSVSQGTWSILVGSLWAFSMSFFTFFN